MSFLINPFIYRVLPNFSGVGLTRIWSLFKTSEATINYCIEISRNGLTTTANTRYVFYDDDGEISRDSKVSNTTTPTAEDLGTFMDAGVGTDDFMITDWYCQITAFRLFINSAATGAPYIAIDTALLTKNGRIYVNFRGTANCYFDSFTGAGVSELDDGNSCSITTVSHNDDSNAIGTILSSNTLVGTSNAARITLYNDTRTNKAHSQIRNTGGTSYVVSLDSQQNSTNQKRISQTLSSTTLTGYYNATAQADVETITGSWVNDNLQVGTQNDGAQLLTGGVQFIGIHNSGISSGTVTTLDGKLNDYFSF